MIEITITVDEIIWPEMICGRFCAGCLKDDQGKESDGPVFGSGAVGAVRTDEKGRPKFCTSGSNEGSSKREYAQRLYQRKKPFCRSGKRIKKDPAGFDAYGNDDAADINIFEEDSNGGTERLLRYILYGIMQGTGESQRAD